MAALNQKYLMELYQYLSSGEMTQDFQFSGEERRLEMLEFLDTLMELGDLADQAASEMIYRDSQLGLMLGGVPGQNPDQPSEDGDKAQK